jgi:hypothetical protein
VILSWQENYNQVLGWNLQIADCEKWQMADDTFLAGEIQLPNW